jgi:hypothetical protein
MKDYKLIKVKRLQKDCEFAKAWVLAASPKNERQLINEMTKYFTGFSLKQKPNGKFHASGEICEETNFINNSVKIGCINFTVPSCTVSFDRDKEGKILNHKQFD